MLAQSISSTEPEFKNKKVQFFISSYQSYNTEK